MTLEGRAGLAQSVQRSGRGAAGLSVEGFLCLDFLVLLDQILSRRAKQIGAKSTYQEELE